MVCYLSNLSSWQFVPEEELMFYSGLVEVSPSLRLAELIFLKRVLTVQSYISDMKLYCLLCYICSEDISYQYHLTCSALKLESTPRKEGVLQPEQRFQFYKYSNLSKQVQIHTFVLSLFQTRIIHLPVQQWLLSRQSLVCTQALSVHFWPIGS